MNYKSFQINTPADVRPWGVRETQAWKDIIDNVVLDCIQTTSDITGHKHYRLFDPNAIARLTITNNAQVYLSAPECAHGMTFYYPTTVFGVIEPIGYTPGLGGDFGLRITGIGTTKGDYGLELVGVLGVADPDDTIAAIRFSGRKRNGTGFDTLAATETICDFANFNTIKMTLTAGGILGIGTQTFNAVMVNGLALANGTEPNAHTDNQIYIYSVDSVDDGLATLGLFTEEHVHACVALPADYYLEIKHNGTRYALLLNSLPGGK